MLLTFAEMLKLAGVVCAVTAMGVVTVGCCAAFLTWIEREDAEHEQD